MFILLLLLIPLLVALVAVWATGCIRYIPNRQVGVVEKLFGGPALASGLIALQNETGFRPEVLRGGIHVFAPCQYRVHRVPLVTIPQGTIGYVFARDGKPLAPEQTLAHSGAGEFQDVRGFLASGGQRGPQRRVLREGTYALNLAQFIVITRDQVFFLALEAEDAEMIAGMQRVIAERNGFTPLVISDRTDQVGVVTVHDGPSLPQGEIIAPIVGSETGGHTSFQDIERFLALGGRRGRQLQVLAEGTYALNRLFVTIELVPKTVIEVGMVGVVVSYTGDTGADLSGEAYGHGETVAQGRRGVWNSALLPGKYAFNTYAGKIVAVPTTNIILKWIHSQTGAHRLDENLAEVSLITQDAFELSLPLSVVIHIDYRHAPLVIQRFGDVRRLVEQTLDPMVAAYFKNVGQRRTVIQLLQERTEIQRQACEEMREKFSRYNLELEEVLIGTPTSIAGDTSIEKVLQQLRLRQVAEEQIETYARQERAAVKERELREAEARARSQQRITESELAITIHGNEGKAEYQRAVQRAAQMRAMAEAEADQTRLHAGGEAARIRAVAEAEAEKIARMGIAQAMAVEEQVQAYGGPRYQLVQQVLCRFAEAVEKSGVEVVPRLVMGGGSNGGTGDAAGGLLPSLLAVLLGEQLAGNDSGATPRTASPEQQRATSAIRETLASALQRVPEKQA